MIADKEYLAMASVPVQTWGALYDKDEVLAAGTIFKELDMPFFAADHIPAKKGMTDPLTEIQKISFILDDLRLYLDTHPDDPDALTLLKRLVKERKSLTADFAKEHYPLTPDCMAAVYEAEPDVMCFCWQEGPAPWEGGNV